MSLRDLRIGFGLTGSHCTLARALEAAERLAAEGAVLTPVFSAAVNETTTRFGTPEQWRERMAKLTKEPAITTIKGAEPIGPRRLLDVMVVAPCTGNTLAKLACGITDTPVTMAAKAHLRNGGPLVIAVSTNDGLGANGKNIGALLNTRRVYFVPFGQDDAEKKPDSLVARMGLLPLTVEAALAGKQIQPLLVEY